MKLNKYTNIEYIYNGRIRKMNLIYSHNIFDRIQLYFSDDIDKIQIIQINNIGDIIVVNKYYYDNIGEKYIRIIAWRLLKKLQYKGISTDAIDIMCIKTFGINDTLHVINIIDNDNSDRITNLKTNIAYIEKLNFSDEATAI